MEDFEMLGPAEKHIASQLRAAVETAKTEARKMLEALEEIDIERVEDALLDSKRKETVIMLVEPLQKLGSNLAMSALTPLLVKVMLTPKEPAAS